MKVFLPRIGDLTGVIIPASYVDGIHDALGVVGNVGSMRPLVARVRQVARHQSIGYIGHLEGRAGVLVATELPEDFEAYFGALGISAPRLFRAENAIETRDKEVISTLWERAINREGFDRERLKPRLLGMNLAGKDVYERAFGRTFADGNLVHRGWDIHPRDGSRKDENGRSPLFLRAVSGDDWAMIARTAVATAARFGRISQQEIDDFRTFAAGGVGEGDQPSPEDFRELIEQEMARSIARGYISTRQEFVNISSGLPPMSERAGKRLTLAQFSTPPVVGWLGARFLGDRLGTVLEPTIGNGVLSAAAAAKGGQVVGWEIDPARAARARIGLEGRAEIETGDFRKVGVTGDRQFSALLANPPYGSLDSSASIGLGSFGGVESFKAKTIEAAIAVEALNKLEVGGNAVLVMPAELYEPTLIQGHRKNLDVLYRRAFAEVETVALDGKLYRSMGASAPVLVHFLKGRNAELSDLPSAVEVSVDTVRLFGSFDELVDWAEERFNLSAFAPEPTLEPPAAPEAPAGPGGGPPEGRPGGSLVPSGAGQGGHGDTTGPIADSPAPPEREDEPTAADEEPAEFTAVEWYDDTLEEDAFTSPYVPFSKVGQGSVVIQRSLQGPVYNALQDVEAAVGDIDEFVAKQIGVDVGKLLEGEILSPEQVDSIALGKLRVQRGEAMIIGDKMGVGKGRQLAALALSALRDDQPVVFMTLDPTLFTDFAARDLRDVSGEKLEDLLARDVVRPFIFNLGTDAALRDPDTGKEVFATPTSERTNAKSSARIDGDHNLVMLTYSQLQTSSGHWRLQAVLNWLDANRDKQPLLLLDEVHKAAGVDSRTGYWVQSIINRAVEVGGNVVYSSATSMKSGKNIVVYSAALPDTGISTRELTTLMESNALSMQEVLSAEMASSGRLIEREMSSAGIERVVVRLADLSEEKMEYARRATDAASDLLAELVDVAPEMRDEAKALAKRLYGGLVLNGQDKTVDVTLTSPASQFDNYSRYLMLAVKGMFTEEMILRSISKGEKPTLVVDSTADTITQWIAANSGLGLGEIDAHPNLGHVLKRNAHRLLDLKISTAMGDSVELRLEKFEGWLQSFKERVDEFNFSRMRLNVLDHIEEVCEANGLLFRDITRRSLTVREQDGRFLVEKRDPVTKAEAIREYGSGAADVLGLNRGAATGLSAHASRVIGPDVRRRAMIAVQFQKDITDQRQVEGRINRFAQVSTPIYYTPSTGFAADERLANLFNRANRNLTSSTSASRENSTNIDGIDLLNPVGDAAVAAWATSNPDIAARMEIDPKGADLGRKLLGRIVCLNLDLQEAVLADIDTIFSLQMERLSREGRNPLRLTRFNWKGTVETVQVLVDGQDDARAMSRRPVVLNRVEYAEHVRWETAKAAAERVAERIRRDPDGADPGKALDFEHLRAPGKSGTGLNFAHGFFREARHGGASVDERFRNIDPLLADKMLKAFREAEQRILAFYTGEAGERPNRTEVATELFLDRMKHIAGQESETPTANAWSLILKGEQMSGQAFRPGRYMLALDRAAERASFFAKYGELLKVGSLVGLRASAINDYMQGEYGRAMRTLGIDDGIVPAVITAVRYPDGGAGNFSDWNISFLTAGSQGYFSASLSSMRTGLSLEESAPKGASPIVPLRDFQSWVGGESKSPELFAKIYGDRWNAVWREWSEAAMPCAYEPDGFNIRSDVGFRAFSILNDTIPAGAKKRERFVLEGNLFSALSLVQSGHKAQGQKAIFTDRDGMNRHAIVLSEKETDKLIKELGRKSQHIGFPTKAFTTPKRMQAYLGMLASVLELGTDGYLSEERKEAALKRLSDSLYDLDQGLWRSMQEEIESAPGQWAHGIAEGMGNASEDMPISIAAGSDPWRWCFDVTGRRGKGREAVMIAPAMVEVRNDGRHSYGPYRLDYSTDLARMKMGLDSIDQSGVVGVFTHSTSFAIVFRKTNPFVKEEPRLASLVEGSLDKLHGVKLGAGLLATEYDLSDDRDIASAADILFAFAKINQNEVVLSGGGKRIFQAVENLSAAAQNEQTARMAQEKTSRAINEVVHPLDAAATP